MQILIVGDTHGHLDILWGLADAAARQGIGAIIQVGDLGFYPRVLVAFQRMWRRLPIPVYAIDGNHEDHPWLAQCVTNGTAAEVWADRLNLIYQPRGSVAMLGGARVGFLGGALHADRPQEGSELWTLGAEPAACNWTRPSDRLRAAMAWSADRCDLVVTHSCPGGIGIGMTGHPAMRRSVDLYIREAGFATGPDDDIGDGELAILAGDLQASRCMPPHWVFGHVHRVHEARVGATRFRCVGSGDATGGDRPGATIYDTETREMTVAAPLTTDPKNVFGPLRGSFEPDDEVVHNPTSVDGLLVTKN
jgi:predicted phosphodiesterase